jgi:polar amino acid transport system substrate-binding protein
MRQILVQAGAAAPAVYELPDPAVLDGQVMIRNRASLISPGTERSSVQLHTSSLLAKARQRPDQVRLVLNKLRTEGISSTVRKVRSRLAEPFVPGYSCAGTITRVGPRVTEFKAGDRVAAAGYGYASHAELVCVPINLTVKIPTEVTFAEAAFGTMGAIALHGVRVTSPSLGETVVVVGLGILGQLTAQILRSAGMQVIAVEPSTFRRDLAGQSGISDTTEPGEQARRLVLDRTGHHGADAIIITAASRAEDLIAETAELARDRGIITVVGDIPLNLPRQVFYQKELQVRLSRSYGPGRYDREYEEKGRDYPYPYVRWTQKRNIAAFLGLIARKQVSVEHLITDHRDVSRAEQAYALLEGPDRDRHLGVVFDYPETDNPPVTTIHLKSKAAKLSADGTFGVGFVGFGQFAGGVLLPAFQSINNLRYTGVATRKGVSAKSAAAKGGFAYATTDYTRVINDPQTDIVVIATTSDLHADLACAALAANKAVFLEKPLALDQPGLTRVVEAVRKHGGMLQVGFNRRYSPALTEIKRVLTPRRTPLAIDYRVCVSRAPAPQQHWLGDPERSGGLLIGEVCHFIDAAIFLTDAHPRTVYARPLGTDAGDDAVAVFMEMADGSVVNIRYLTGAAPGTPKEYVDIVGGGITAYVNDFRLYGWAGNGRPQKRRGTQNKGHVEQLKAFTCSLRQKGMAAGDLIAAVYATEATFAAQESMRSGGPVAVIVDF